MRQETLTSLASSKGMDDHTAFSASMEAQAAFLVEGGLQVDDLDRNQLYSICSSLRRLGTPGVTSRIKSASKAGLVNTLKRAAARADAQKAKEGDSDAAGGGVVYEGQHVPDSRLGKSGCMVSGDNMLPWVLIHVMCWSWIWILMDIEQLHHSVECAAQ
jgi:hypothetical protein